MRKHVNVKIAPKTVTTCLHAQAGHFINMHHYRVNDLINAHKISRKQTAEELFTITKWFDCSDELNKMDASTVKWRVDFALNKKRFEFLIELYILPLSLFNRAIVSFK